MQDQSLDELIRNLSPRLNDGEFVFCVDKDQIAQPALVIASFREHGGQTVVLPQTEAKRLGLNFESVMAWITLDVQSSLDSVGLTARVSTVLAEAGIACNVMAGCHHDHLFVPIAKAQRAMEILNQLTSQKSKQP